MRMIRILLPSDAKCKGAGADRHGTGTGFLASRRGGDRTKAGRIADWAKKTGGYGHRCPIPHPPHAAGLAPRSHQAQDQPRPGADPLAPPPPLAVVGRAGADRCGCRHVVRAAAARRDGPDDAGRDDVSVAAVRPAERHRLRRRAAQGGDFVEGHRPARMARRDRRLARQGRRHHRAHRRARRRRACRRAPRPTWARRRRR